MGIQGRAMGQPGNVCALVAEPIREGVSHPHPGGPRRAGFPRPIHPGPGAFHRAATAESAFEIANLPRRGTLDSQASEQPPLVSNRHGLDRYVDQKVKIAIVLFLSLILFLGALALVSKEPSLKIDPPVTAIGKSTPV